MRIAYTIGFVIMAAAVGVAACGGDEGSGVDRGKRVTALTADERRDVCEWSTAELGGEGHTTQCGDTTFKVEPTSECIEDSANYPASCTLTVGQLEDCTAAMAAAPCTGLASPACAPIFNCIGEE